MEAQAVFFPQFGVDKILVGGAHYVLGQGIFKLFPAPSYHFVAAHYCRAMTKGCKPKNILLLH